MTEAVGLKPGSTLRDGAYRIIRTLGQGGFGITYLAEQVMLGRKVAVKEFFMKDCCEREGETSKVSVPTQNNRELVEKFKGKFIREARMIASLENPHIVRVLEVFEENGTAYYAMECLPGGSLADKVKSSGRLSEAEAERYIRQVASALEYIHSRRMVHLDIKPSNILLNSLGEAVLIDFGISKHYDSSGEQTSNTPVGISKGYAPLEQGRDGDVSQFTPATDIYALGATLHYLVTGIVPADASSVFDVGLSRPYGISDRIWRVIEKAMQPRKGDRPQSIPEFLSLLDNHVQDTPDKHVAVLTGEEDTVVKYDNAPAPPVKKEKSSVVTIAIVIAVALLSLAVILPSLIKKESREPLKVLEESNMPSGVKSMSGYMSGSAGTSNIAGTYTFTGNKIHGTYGYLGNTSGIRVEGTMYPDGTFTADEWNEKTGEHCGHYSGRYTKNSLTGTFVNYMNSSFTFNITVF